MTRVLPAAGAPSLDAFDPSAALSKKEYRRRKKELQLRLLRAQQRLRRAPHSLVVVFEGIDAAGKGGAIRRLTERLDPRGYVVHAVGPPNEVERRHHWLWRFSQAMPEGGRIAVFDRSWYGRVLVERVEGLADEPAWRRAYDEIVNFEETHAAEGALLVKLWLQVTKDEQLARFRAREEDPFKRYKITDEDWRNRERWDDYLEAAEEMFQRTHAEYAPWVVVSGEDKRWARVQVLEAVTERLEHALETAD